MNYELIATIPYFRCQTDGLISTKIEQCTKRFFYF